MFSLSSSPGHEGCLKPLGREGPPMFMEHSLSLSHSLSLLCLSPSLSAWKAVQPEAHQDFRIWAVAMRRKNGGGLASLILAES